MHKLCFTTMHKWRKMKKKKIDKISKEKET